MSPSQSTSWTQRLVLPSVSLPAFMLQLGGNIVAVSIPAISRSLHADFAAIEWVISAYTLSFAALMMPSGALADRYGRKRVLLVGLALFTIASLFCGAAPNLPVLVAARAIQGMAAALQLAGGLAILSHSFRGEARSRAFAFYGSVLGIAICAGPIIGGVITEALGWRWAFYINLPVGVATLPLVVLCVPESRDAEAVRLDVGGALAFSGFLFLTTLALITGVRLGWDDARIFGEAAAAALCLAAFVWAERAQARPMLDLAFLRRPTYLGANIIGLSYAAGFLTMLTFLPIYLQSGLGLAPRAAGLAMLPLAAPLFVVPRITTRLLVYWFSGRALLCGGMALTAAGLAWMSLETERHAYLPMLGGMLTAGLGAGVLNGEIQRVGMSVIPPGRAGMASGVSGTVRFSGMVIGFAALGAVLSAAISAGVDAAQPSLPAAARLALSHKIAAGNLSSDAAAHALALRVFCSGYSALLLASALVTALAALLGWRLVRAAETAPLVARPAPVGQAAARLKRRA
jgi:EmrB/QacA subfamily drug resistance transporter